MELNTRVREIIEKKQALNNIKELLQQVDNNVESVPGFNNDKLYRFISSLKGEQLSTHEKVVVAELARK